MNWQAIPFPDKNTIYTDYITHPERLSRFFPISPFHSLEPILEQRVRQSFPRNALAAILEQQHRQWGTTPAITTHLKALKLPHTLAVVTGQQAGILVSPLYTIYKIMTTIQLVHQLQLTYPQYRFVPVFWMEVDDSDFKEIAHCHLLTRQNTLMELHLEEPPEDSGKPIFLRQLPQTISQWPEQITDAVLPTEFLESVLNRYFGAYRSGESFVTAFARMLVQLFGDHGLLVLNPSDKAVKSLGTPILRTAIEQRHEILEIFWQRNRELEAAGYHSQIHLKHQQTLLFWIDDSGKRVRLDCDSNDHCFLRYSNSGKQQPYQQVLEAIERTPERFTTNVALRPIFQDAVIPTGIYVGGPAEIAYFAQLHALYPLFNIPMPVIFPRHRITIVERKIQKIIEKYAIEYPQLFQENFHFLENDLARRLAHHPLQQQLAEIQHHIARQLQQLTPTIQVFDPTLVKSLQHTQQSIDHALQKFSHKIQRAFERQETTRSEHLKRLLLYIFPKHHPQERVLAPLYFQIKYGWDFWYTLLETLPTDVRTHWVVEL